MHHDAAMIAAAFVPCDCHIGIKADGSIIGNGQITHPLMVYHHSRKAIVDCVAAFGKKQWRMIVDGGDSLHSDEKSGGINATNGSAVPFDMTGTDGLTTDRRLIVNGDRNRTAHRRLHIRAVKKDAMPRACGINVSRETIERQEHPFILIDWTGKRSFFEDLPQVNSSSQLSCLCATCAATACQSIDNASSHNCISSTASQR